MAEDRPVYWTIPAAIMDELREEGVVCNESDPAELGKAIFQFLREADYPNELAEKVLDCLDGGSVILH